MKKIRGDKINTKKTLFEEEKKIVHIMEYVRENINVQYTL